MMPAFASLLLSVVVRAENPRWTVEFKEGSRTFLTAGGEEVRQTSRPGAIPGWILVRLPDDVDPATTNGGVYLGRVRVPERRVAWLKRGEFAVGELLPAHHLLAVTPFAGFEPGPWVVEIRNTVKDRNGRVVNPTKASWTIEIGERAPRPDDSGTARNALKLKFTAEVDPASYADGIVVERRAGDAWREEPRGSVTIAPAHYGGPVNEVALLPLGGWERGATYRIRVTRAIRGVDGRPLNDAEDFSFTVPKSGPLETRHEPRRPVAQQANSQAAATSTPPFPGGQAMGWHGHWTDPVTGLVLMGARWYDPRSGTFLSPDPLGDIDSVNLYLFGKGRPHEFVDPTGMAVRRTKHTVPLVPGTVAPAGYPGAPYVPPDYIPGGSVEVASATSSTNQLADLGDLFDLGMSEVEAFSTMGRRNPGTSSQNAAVTRIGASIDPFAGYAYGMFLFSSLFVGPIPEASGFAGLAGGSELGTAAARARSASVAARSTSSLPVLNPHFTPNLSRVLQNVTNEVNADLAANPALAQTVLTRPEYDAGRRSLGVAKMQYGNAVERLADQRALKDPFLRDAMRRVSGPHNPDFVGEGIFRGMNFDITTPAQEAAHLKRPGYGLGLNVIKYERPAGFTLFP